MRIRSVVLAVVYALALAPLAAICEEEGIRVVDAAWLKAIKANDLEGLVACYARDAAMWLPDTAEARGTEAIRNAYKGLLTANTVTDVSLTNDVSQTSGDLSTSWGNYVLALQPRQGGAPVVLKGRYLAVAKKVGGKWLYVADHASNEPAPPAPAAPK